ncbi:MAG: hypothetical protein IM638_13025 [Bacteroidetes bacterium]|nr:hypothetical protein [Bacteroidota bacterium]
MIPALILLFLHSVLAVFAIRVLNKSHVFTERVRKTHQWLCLLVPFLWSLFTLAASRSKAPEVMASHVRRRVRSDESPEMTGNYVG